MMPMMIKPMMQGGVEEQLKFEVAHLAAAPGLEIRLAAALLAAALLAHATPLAAAAVLGLTPGAAHAVAAAAVARSCRRLSLHGNGEEHEADLD